MTYIKTSADSSGTGSPLSADRPTSVQSSSTTWRDDDTDDNNDTSSAAVPMMMTNVRKTHASEPIQFIQLNLQCSQSASILLPSTGVTLFTGATLFDFPDIA